LVFTHIGYGPLYVLTPSEVQHISHRLAQLTPDEIAYRYQLDNNAVDRELTVQEHVWFEYGRGHLNRLIRFLSAVAGEQQGVIFYLA